MWITILKNIANYPKTFNSYNHGEADFTAGDAMKIVTIASVKGGSCKTTCTAIFAARATKDGGKVAIIDFNDDQGNLTDWWEWRKRPENPILVESLEDIGDLKKQGFAWVFIDTPPMGFANTIEPAISISDAVVIPVRASPLDISSTNGVASSCRHFRKPFIFLLADVHAKESKLLEQAKNALMVMAKPLGRIMPDEIYLSHRPSYVQAMGVGKTAYEIDAKSRSEIDGVWAEIKKLAGVER